VETIQLNKAEKAFLRFLETLTQQDDNPTNRYSVAVNIEVRFVRSKLVSATPVRVTNDSDAPAVQLTEEDLRARYPWDYAELTHQCKQRYPGFKVNKSYHERRKCLAQDQRYAYVRALDPHNPKSTKKTFYSQAILEKLDPNITS
jgi:hypothetical protein